MYEDVDLPLPRLHRVGLNIIHIDVRFVQAYCGPLLIVVDVYRMADADNRVILNVGGIRHETCKSSAHAV